MLEEEGVEFLELHEEDNAVEGPEALQTRQPVPSACRQRKKKRGCVLKREGKEKKKKKKNLSFMSERVIQDKTADLTFVQEWGVNCRTTRLNLPQVVGWSRIPLRKKKEEQNEAKQASTNNNNHYYKQSNDNNRRTKNKRNLSDNGGVRTSTGICEARGNCTACDQHRYPCRCTEERQE